MSASTSSSVANLPQGAQTAARTSENTPGDPAVHPSTNQPGSALVPVSHANKARPRIIPEGAVARLPVELEVGVPLRDFRVHNLLSLASGSVIESQWTHGEDVPIAAGKVQLAWAEFEVMDSQLAVRITRLA